MLHGHSNRVNCVCWVTERLPEVPPFSRETDRPIELLSGSVDKTVNLWRETGGKVSDQVNRSLWINLFAFLIIREFPSVSSLC